LSKRRIGFTGQPEVKRRRVKALFEEVSEFESVLSGSVSSINEDDNHK